MLLAGLAAALLPGLAAGQNRPAAEATLPPQQLLRLLRQGGLVVYLRHTTTQRDYADQVTAVMGDCATQRRLSPAGEREAREIGNAFRRLRVPVDEVISSQYCRAARTAVLAFGRHRETAALNFEPAEDYTEAQTAAMRERVVPLLAAVPPAGRNTVLVGHDDPFEAATGVYPEPMGAAWVVRPNAGGGFTLLGSIGPRQWAALR